MSFVLPMAAYLGGLAAAGALIVLGVLDAVRLILGT
jgi:hypothetical protein